MVPLAWSSAVVSSKPVSPKLLSYTYCQWSLSAVKQIKAPAYLKSSTGGVSGLNNHHLNGSTTNIKTTSSSHD